MYSTTARSFPRGSGLSVRRADAKQDVRGKQGAKQHHFRGEEEPDADLGVIKAGVLARLYCVGNVHEWNQSGSFCGVKSFACPGTLYS